MFNEPKAVRLAFHDCMPYEDGGGCDGCLNFEANEDEHNVLQHSVAILVIQFYPGLYMIGYGKGKIILKFPPFFRLNEENQEWENSKHQMKT